MAKPKRYYWMKLKESFMSSDTIDYFMSQPGGANYVVLYQMLCLKTINTNGRLSRQIGEIIIPYDVSKIQRDTKWFSIDTVRTALNLYKMAGLIYEDVDGTLVLSGHTELVGSETESSSRMRKLRNKPSQTALEEPSQCDADCDAPVTEDAEPGDVLCDADTPQNVTTEIENRDRDKRLDTRDGEKEGEGDTADKPPAPSRSPIPYDSIQGFYNHVCTSFPCCTIMNESRKKMIRARLRSGYTVEDFTRVFIKAENSSFLKGANSRNWTATFDWLIKDGNMAKVLDGNFDDKKGDEPHDAGPHDPATGNYGTWL